MVKKKLQKENIENKSFIVEMGCYNYFCIYEKSR